MTTEKVYTQDEVVTFAAELLSRRYGGVPEFTQVTDLGGSGNALVLRARMTPAPFRGHQIQPHDGPFHRRCGVAA